MPHPVRDIRRIVGGRVVLASRLDSHKAFPAHEAQKRICGVGTLLLCTTQPPFPCGDKHKEAHNHIARCSIILWGISRELSSPSRFIPSAAAVTLPCWVRPLAPSKHPPLGCVPAS